MNIPRKFVALIPAYEINKSTFLPSAVFTHNNFSKHAIALPNFRKWIKSRLLPFRNNSYHAERGL